MVGCVIPSFEQYRYVRELRKKRRLDEQRQRSHSSTNVTSATTSISTIANASNSTDHGQSRRSTKKIIPNANYPDFMSEACLKNKQLSGTIEAENQLNSSSHNKETQIKLISTDVSQCHEDYAHDVHVKASQKLNARCSKEINCSTTHQSQSGNWMADAAALESDGTLSPSPKKQSGYAENKSGPKKRRNWFQQNRRKKLRQSKLSF